MLRPCLSCGEPSAGTRCPAHTRNLWTSARARGYSAAWDRLSRRLRREACCADCGTRAGLQLDHLPGAWERVEQGLPLRPLLDVEVRCGPCNRAAGPARGRAPRGVDPTGNGAGLVREATRRSDTGATS